MSGDGVIDLSDAPRHTGFGEDTGDGTSGDLAASAAVALGNAPAFSMNLAIDGAYDQASAVAASLYDGDATADELLALGQECNKLLVAAVELVDLGVSNWNGIDPSYWSGVIVKARLDFLLSCFQPLQDTIGMFTGNGDRIKVSGRMWGPLRRRWSTWPSIWAGTRSAT
ncbi:hypothetical protein GCM10029992_13380 [Glycomyces albus]